MTLEDILNARIIPARAGFTLTAPMRRTANPDHPRSRGVYWVFRRSCCGAAGSSPLARGLLTRWLTAGLMVWIIPARAGFTSTTCPAATSAGDHPRSRGVYVVGAYHRMRPGGSSPLARGLRHHALPLLRVHGIIPARAGFTVLLRPRPRENTDHPRSRGVYVRRGAQQERAAGSSPLARGLPPWNHDSRLPGGIIPARAGFTRGVLPPLGSCTDHPRSRGVYLTVAILNSKVAGIIPARAGFTTRERPARGPVPDHPRSRGVYEEERNTAMSTIGSSPLARGLPQHSGRDRRNTRIIPARAGFTFHG